MLGRRYLLVGQEGGDGAGALGRADLFDRGCGHAALVLLVVELAVALDGDLHPLGEGIDHRGAHAVQAAGDLVGLAAELAAGVQHGHDRLQGGDSWWWGGSPPECRGRCPPR